MFTDSKEFISAINAAKLANNSFYKDSDHKNLMEKLNQVHKNYPYEFSFLTPLLQEANASNELKYNAGSNTFTNKEGNDVNLSKINLENNDYGPFESEDTFKTCLSRAQRIIDGDRDVLDYDVLNNLKVFSESNAPLASMAKSVYDKYMEKINSSSN